MTTTAQEKESGERWTKGPWHVCKEPKSRAWGEGSTIGSFNAMYLGEPIAVRVADAFTLVPNEEMRANAHLIAAAPSMYKALDNLLTRYLALVNSGDCGFWDAETEPEVIATRAALKLARGDTP